MTHTPRPITCDARVCIRLPKKLVELVSRECKRNDETLSVFVRSALVDVISQAEIDRAMVKVSR